jgi:mono/diheme cytochrome c family protein
MSHPTRARAGSIFLALLLAAALGLVIAAFAVAQDDGVIIVDTGAPVYASTCKVCHGVIAEGKQPPGRVQSRHSHGLCMQQLP